MTLSGGAGGGHWDTPLRRQTWASPDAGRHDAAATFPRHGTVAALNVLVMGHAQVVAHLVGHGGRHTDGVLVVVLQGEAVLAGAACTTPTPTRAPPPLPQVRLGAGRGLLPTTLLKAPTHPPGEVAIQVFQPMWMARGRACGPRSPGLPFTHSAPALNRAPHPEASKPRPDSLHTWFTAPEPREHMDDTLASPTVVPVKSTPLETRGVRGRGCPESRLPPACPSFSHSPPWLQGPSSLRPRPTYVISCALSCW